MNTRLEKCSETQPHFLSAILQTFSEMGIAFLVALVSQL